MEDRVHKEVETPIEIIPEYKENPTMENLWKEIFKDEYKPDSLIDFQKVKNIILDKKGLYEQWKMRYYNTNIISPEKLCDIFINHPPKQLSISFLESLPKNIKRCLADLFLELLSSDAIQKKLWTAMLFWIRHHCYSYSDYRSWKLRDLLIANDFVWSKNNYYLLEKAHMSNWQLHSVEPDIQTALAEYEMFKNLPKDIDDKKIQNYVKEHVGEKFSLGVLQARRDNTKGKEQDWYWKDLDAKWNIIDREMIKKTTTYVEEILHGEEKRLEVVNRKNPDIHKDFSWTLYKIFLDGPIAISLFHEKKPIALVSFSLQNSETIFIHQMQAIMTEHFDTYGRAIAQKTSPIVQTIPWQKGLYDIVEMVAKKYKCKKIVIQSWENNEWIYKMRSELSYDEKRGKTVEVSLDQPHLSLDIAEKIYDTFAMKQWFKQDEKSKNWNKKL